MKKGFRKVRSMRERMLFLLLLSAVAIVGVSALVSLTLFQFSDADQTQESMKFLLKQIGTQIDQSYMAMINFMDQMAPGGETGNLVTEYLEETEAYEKYKLRRNLIMKFLVTNPTLYGRMRKERACIPLGKSVILWMKLSILIGC